MCDAHTSSRKGSLAPNTRTLPLLAFAFFGDDTDLVGLAAVWLFFAAFFPRWYESARARGMRNTTSKPAPAADSRGWLQLGLNSPVLRPCLRPAHARTSGGGPRGAWRAAAATHLSAVRRRACVSPSPPSWFAMRYFSIAATEEPVRSPRAVMAREMRAAARGGGVGGRA